jgi:predicted peptidase
MASESKLTYLPTVSNLPIHIFESQNASAHIIGFVGGNGLKNKSGISKNYIVKQRSVFVNSGINFYLFPNFDQNEKASYKLRASQKRIKRIRALIKFIKEADDKPIYLLGFSRGSVDAGAFSKSHPALIEGIILMSGVYKNKSKKAHDFSMDKIIGTKTSVTTLLVHHEKDLCKVTKFAEAKKFYANLNSPKKMMLTFSDGEGSGKACGPKNFHGYEKIEAYVARSVAQWIIENLPHK